jgi:hypothetical protein
MLKKRLNGQPRISDCLIQISFGGGITAEIRSAAGRECSGAFSPRVPVAIKSEAASRIAIVSVAVTSITGAFIDPNRGACHRALSFEEANGFGKIILT